MYTCRICLRSFQKLKFKSDDIGICTRCVNTLNDSPEPAIEAQKRIAAMLARGMQRTAHLDLQSEEEWKHRKARRTLGNIESAVAAALPAWLNKLLADTDNSTRDFKIMRAHRRGLLRMDGPAVLDLPGNWLDVRQRILERDDRQCKTCHGADRTLDVHHVVHRAHFGTNQQANLITLCRACHQNEHPGTDLGSSSWVRLSPPKPPPQPTSPAGPATSPAPITETRTELICPRCKTGLLVAIQKPQQQRVRCPVCQLIFAHNFSPAPLKPSTQSPTPSTSTSRVTAESTHRQHADLTPTHHQISEATRLKCTAICFCASHIPLLAIFGSTGITWWTSAGVGAMAYWLVKV